jgi:hypothetical protein
MTYAEITMQFELANELATELHNGIWEDAAMWMQTPSELFFGRSPELIIASGDGYIVIDWLMIRAGKKPGAAF